MSKKSNTEEFIKKARAVHGDKYNYSKVDYIDSHTKVIIICPKHGEFEQAPTGHLTGNDCRKCTNDSKKSNTNEFIEKANIKHNNFYDYSKVDYINARTKIIIICPEHGEFTQKPNSHLRGKGCLECKIVNNTFTREEFIERANIKHENFYDYSNVVYTHSQTKISIICPEHGEFTQKPNGHLIGRGCPRCYAQLSRSRQEMEVGEFVNSLGISFISNDRTTILNQETGKYLEIDLWFPQLNKAIELQGDYWHTLANVAKKDQYKVEYCEWKDIDLLIIWEHEWKNSKKGVERDIKDFLQG